MKGEPVMRFVGNRQQPEEDPKPQPLYQPVRPEFPISSEPIKLRWPASPAYEYFRGTPNR
jgi:hypothetical protein